MKKIFLIGLVFVLLGVFSFFNVETSPAETRFITIATASVSGVYYPLGGAWAKIVNKRRDKYNIRATVESTAGSVYNINALMAGTFDIGGAQSKAQYNAWRGLKEWKDLGPQKDLRSICSFHPEVITLVATDNSGIKTFMDVKGKHVSIGNVGSGERGNAIDALAAFGLDWEKDIRAEGFRDNEAAKMLQDGRIDAFFMTIGHPSGAIKEATSGRTKVHFVPVAGPQIDKLVAKYSYFAKAYVPVKLYPMATNKEDVDSFAVKCTYLANAKLEDDIVYAFTKELFENLEEFKTLHPCFAVLTREKMLEALTAPFHPGARRYYKEVGLLK